MTTPEGASILTLRTSSKRPKKKPSPTKSPPPPDATSIHSLPSELLCNILTHVLVPRKQPMSLRYRQDRRKQPSASWKSNRGRRYQPLDNLLVCRAFYFAGVEAYYGGNEFDLASVEHLTRFVGHIGVDRREAIRSINCTTLWLVERVLAATNKPEEVEGRKWVACPLGQSPGEPVARLDFLSQLPNLRRMVARVEPHMHQVVVGKDMAEVEREVESAVRAAWALAEGVKLEFRHLPQVVSRKEAVSVWSPAARDSVLLRSQ